MELGRERLPASLTESRSPLTVGELAAAAGMGPPVVGAILALHDHGRLAATRLPGPRFALRLA